MQNNTDKLDHLIALAASKCLDEEAKALMDIDPYLPSLKVAFSLVNISV